MKRIILMVFGILNLLVALFGIGAFFVLGALNFLFAGIGCLIWGLVCVIVSAKKKGYIVLSVFAVLSLLGAAFVMYFITPPLIFSSPWRYPFQVRYSRVDNTVPEDFPESIPAGATDYTFEFMPSFMQGSGFLTVGFTAPSDYAARVEEDCKAKAVKELPMTGSTTNGSTVAMRMPREISEAHPNGIIYVLYQTPEEEWNHPHAKIVLVDGDYLFYSLV
ncbi:hypothetical protein SAMN02910456_01847 [Ruminococcaceae bacterium YRB3002]|nr:hypothetical protein SAMN02910456_01847 [Ruminococcaceae bacterium YRB3002]